ncbi:MAG: hypothetical protein HPZ91_14570 [Lentisphaeria bacterium]|nr:hypothetical protein [Lentisphaeria bacterium]
MGQRPAVELKKGDAMFIRGISFGFMGRNGYYRSEAGRRGADDICSLGADWVALIVTVAQERYSSTRMFADYVYTPSDIEVAEAVKRFHAAGVKVMLKPMIECLDSVWRGNIRFPEKQMMIQGICTDYWGEWFGHYAECMEHYGRFAEENGVELFCIGCELLGTEDREAFWPGVIDRVRQVYRGPVTYNADQIVPGRENCRGWYSKLDLLGISFYTGTERPNPSAAEIAADLQEQADRVEAVSRKLGIPVFFAECGARSVVNGALRPWDYTNSGDYDGAAQANYLAGVIEAFSCRDWWRGLMWWKWDEQQKRPHYTQPGGDTGFTIHGKPAAEVLRRWCAEGGGR